MRFTFATDEASQCVDKRISVQRKAYFQMDCAHSKAGKHAFISLNLVPASYYCNWFEVVDVCKVKGGLPDTT